MIGNDPILFLKWKENVKKFVFISIQLREMEISFCIFSTLMASLLASQCGVLRAPGRAKYHNSIANLHSVSWKPRNLKRNAK